jgi:hypothetical protein
MLVAFYDSTGDSSFTVNDYNFMCIKDVDFLPTQKSILEIERYFYIIDTYKPITFSQFNQKIMCCWVRQLYFDEHDSNYHSNLEREWNVMNRKKKIDDVLNDM